MLIAYDTGSLSKENELSWQENLIGYHQIPGQKKKNKKAVEIAAEWESCIN